jgi:uncharacterized protein YjeT (DUF2065 family)
MSPLALVLIVIGLLIAISRAPLLFAPERTRSFYLSMMETDGRMRLIGILVLALAAVMIWAAAPEATMIATIIHWLGVLMLVIAASFILLPGQMRGLATSIWSGFSTSALRGIGAVAAIIGLCIAAYGLSL